FIVLELGSPVEPEAWNADHGKLDGQDVTLFARRKVSRCAKHCANGRIGKSLGVKSRRILGVAIVPKANRVLCWLDHVMSPSRCNPRPGQRCAGRRSLVDSAEICITDRSKISAAGFSYARCPPLLPVRSGAFGHQRLREISVARKL